MEVETLSTTSDYLEGKTTEELILELEKTGDEQLREEVIARHDGLIRTLARKFARPGVQVEDLEQTGWLALIRAVDRFDPKHRARFSTYVTHCIVGEIKRYFRDRTWAMRIPRTLKNIAVNLGRKQDALIQRLGREPTMAEMAAAFEVSEETLAEAIELRDNYHLAALEDRFGGDEGGAPLHVRDTVGEEDPRLARVEEYAPLHVALDNLEPRDRWILARRYLEGWTQQEVAAELHLSQMHISRLERRALAALREQVPAP